ncbi:hypothetical protein O7634_01710 [Micromonospora sp. WMMD1120]|nr:hypothetical protein [Micromonospora sp. WMMD1120]MDG4805476.1 hypothetical protein [Micromonospora sp. WMMD1120]
MPELRRALAVWPRIDDAYSLGLRPDLTALHTRFLDWLFLARRHRGSHRF